MPTPSAAVIIPAYNEEPGIARVIADIPGDLVSEIIVVDNGSTDRTALKAQEAGARVVFQPERGYGAACLAGISCPAPPVRRWFCFWTATTATTRLRRKTCSGPWRNTRRTWCWAPGPVDARNRVP